MTAFATHAELARLLKLDTIDEPAAALLLDLAADAVRAEVGQRIDRQAGDQIRRDAHGTEHLLLPELPVTNVTAVVCDGTPLMHGIDYTWSPSGMLTRLDGVWPRRARAVTVTYDHGYDPVPGVARAVCLQVAARLWLSPAGAQIAGERAGSWSVTYRPVGSGSGIELTDYERRLLDQLRPGA